MAVHRKNGPTVPVRRPAPGPESKAADRAQDTAKAQAPRGPGDVLVEGNAGAPLVRPSEPRSEQLKSAARTAVHFAEDLHTRYEQSFAALSRAELPAVTRHLSSLFDQGTVAPTNAAALQTLRDETEKLAQQSREADLNAHQAVFALAQHNRGQGDAPIHVRLSGGTAPLPVRLSKMSPDERTALLGLAVPARIADAPRVHAEGLIADRQPPVVQDARAAIFAAVDEIGTKRGKQSRHRATVRAAATLANIMAKTPPHHRGAVLQQSRPALLRLALSIEDLTAKRTESVVHHLTRAAASAGAENAFLLTGPIAEQVAAGRLEEDGTFLNRREHRSEQEFADAVYAVMTQTGEDTFARSLAQQLVGAEDVGFAQAIATGGSVPGKNTWERGNEKLDQALDDVAAFVGEMANAGGDYVRERLGTLSGVERKVGELDSKGDKFTMGLELEVASGVAVSAAAELSVKRKKKDEYIVKVSGEASAGIFGALGAQAGLFGGALEGEANVTGFVEVEARFATREAAAEAARVIAGIGLASALTGPVGAVVVGATAKEEMRPFLDGLSASRVGIELQGKAELDLGLAVGHAGLSAENEVKAKTSATLEFKPGQAPALVLASELEGESVLRVGREGLPLPGGGELELGSVGAMGTVGVETTVDLEGIGLADVMRDPVGTLKKIPGRVADGETTLSAEVTLQGVWSAASDLPLDADVEVRGGGAAITAELSATLPHRELGDAAQRAFSGDLKGAVASLSEDTELDVATHSLDRRGFDIDLGIKAGVFKIGVEAEYVTDDKTKMYRFRGSPQDLLADAADFFDTITDPLTAPG